MKSVLWSVSKRVSRENRTSLLSGPQKEYCKDQHFPHCEVHCPPAYLLFINMLKCFYHPLSQILEGFHFITQTSKVSRFLKTVLIKKNKQATLCKSERKEYTSLLSLCFLASQGKDSLLSQQNTVNALMSEWLNT